MITRRAREALRCQNAIRKISVGLLCMRIYSCCHLPYCDHRPRCCCACGVGRGNSQWLAVVTPVPLSRGCTARGHGGTWDSVACAVMARGMRGPGAGLTSAGCTRSASPGTGRVTATGHQRLGPGVVVVVVLAGRVAHQVIHQQQLLRQQPVPGAATRDTRGGGAEGGTRTVEMRPQRGATGRAGRRAHLVTWLWRWVQKSGVSSTTDSVHMHVV